MNPDKNNRKNRKEKKNLFPFRYFSHGFQSSIQVVLMTTFTASFVILFTVFSALLASLNTRQNNAAIIERANQTEQQSIAMLENYLNDSRQIADTLHYDVIKGKDLSKEGLSFEFNMFYQANSSKYVSIALFRSDGSLINASPISVLKEDGNVTSQSWFLAAQSNAENMHYSSAHVQDIFRTSQQNYPWVISLSAAVQIQEDGDSSFGVLLLDMNYDTLADLMDDANRSSSGIYTYLCTADGTMLYHPSNAGLTRFSNTENNRNDALLSNGTHETEFNGQSRTLIVDTVAYTGWKMITVIPESALNAPAYGMRYLILSLTSLFVFIALYLNRLIAGRISSPLVRLNDAIANLENIAVFPDEMYAGGSEEVQNLGRTLQAYLRQIQYLLDDVVKEEEEKRRYELDALQSQINPHFLYNTLDSIVWMIEGERYREAVFMITQLASLFRISLNRGCSIISIENELKHAEAYLNIQKIRYRNAFEFTSDIRDGIENCCTVKLIIQPILENAIYHGIRDAEEDGEIHITGCRKGDDIFLTVSDNGYGMSREETEAILKGSEKPVESRRGSGVGLINVHNRIRLRFGESYGLKVESEPDEGTSVTIRIPAVEATEENMSLLEKAEYRKEDASHEE